MTPARVQGDWRADARLQPVDLGQRELAVRDRLARANGRELTLTLPLTLPLPLTLTLTLGRLPLLQRRREGVTQPA